MSATVRHGTRYRYDRGCRCDECRAAKLRDRRAARARARAKQSPSYQRELAAARACKERYRGTCVDCGAPTTGGDGRAKAPERCYRCTPRVTGAKRIGTGHRQRAILAYLNGTTRTWSEIRAELNVSSGATARALDTMLRRGLIVRVSRGVYRSAA